MPNAADYEARAVERIKEILAVEHAVVRRELESRIAEGFSPRSGLNIDPHHITNALASLIHREEVEWVRGPTRGGADVETLQPTNRSGRGDRIDRAAARKRLLPATNTIGLLATSEDWEKYGKAQQSLQGDPKFQEAMAAAGQIGTWETYVSQTIDV